jgi:putative membrane protein
MSLSMAVFLLPLAQWDHHDMDGGWWIVMAVGMLLFWGLVIAGLIWLVRTVLADRHRAVPAGRESNAIEILDRRLAEGDIEIEEYRARREELERTKGP